MKMYVLDTTFFVDSRKYYSSIFTSFWEAMGEAVQKGSICSVDEVKNEIEHWGGKQEHLLGWVKTNKHSFAIPQDEIEQGYLIKILELEKFQNHGKKQTHTGPYWADPFVIAKAKRIGGTVVTEENSAKDNRGKIQSIMRIPDVCEEFDVPCVSGEQFMKDQGWQF